MAIAEWQEGQGKPGGRAEAALRLDEAYKLLERVANVLSEVRREMLALAAASPKRPARLSGRFAVPYGKPWRGRSPMGRS